MQEKLLPQEPLELRGEDTPLPEVWTSEEELDAVLDELFPKAY